MGSRKKIKTGEYEGLDRRYKSDRLLKSLFWIGLLGWLLLILGVVFLDQARLDTSGFIDPAIYDKLNFPVNLRRLWNQELLGYFFYLMIAGLLISLAGLLINYLRHRREGDRYRLHLMLMGSMSLAGLAYYLI